MLESEYIDHKSAVKQIAEKFGLEEKKVDAVIKGFFGYTGIRFFLRNLRIIKCQGLGDFKRSKFTGYKRISKKYKLRLARRKWYYNRYRKHTRRKGGMQF